MKDASATVKYRAVLPGAERLRETAHGMNRDDTCSAVAVSLALAYLDPARLPAELQPEHLESLQPDVRHAVEDVYPQAHRLHRALVDSGMKRASFAMGITLPLRRFWKTHPRDGKEPTPGKKRESRRPFRLRWTLFPRPRRIAAELAAGRPVLVTTAQTRDAFRFHTMLAYGIEGNTRRDAQLLVHSGWYGDYTERTENGALRQKELRYPLKKVLFGYYFR